MTTAALSLIVAVRTDGGELDEFLESLATQHLTDDVECIFIVMGPDAALTAVRNAIRDHGIEATVVRASTADVSTARREAIAMASGEWVTFPNARDVFGQHYVEVLLDEISDHGDAVDAIAVPARSLSSTARWVEPHPGRTLELDESLAGLTGDVTRLALRRTAVAVSGAVTDDYNDELLVLDLLRHRGTPAAVRFAGKTLYMRRPLPPLDPQTQRLRGNAGNYLALLDEIAGRLPETASQTSWKHRFTLRAITRLLAYENTTVRRATTLRGDAGAQFRAAFRGLLTRYDDRLFARHAERVDAADERRDLLLALQGRTGVASAAHVVSVDADASLMQVRHTRWSPTETEEFAHDGEPIVPTFGKHRAIEAFGATIYHERIAWVPTDVRLTLRVDGDDVALRLADGEPLRAGEPDDLAAQVDAHLKPGAAVGAEPEPKGGGWRATVRRARESWLSRAAAVRALAHTPWVARRFNDAWLLMDRANMGRDNAEHMYRWLKLNHPEVNAWFVLRSDSPDFARLKAEGFRVVPYGSLRHQLLLNKTTQYLSSHVGIDVSRPIFDRYLLRNASWTFTFLQHGVIHNDLSIWLNRQKMRFLVTSTHQEYAGLAGDDTPYVCTEREARLTGLPRFDALRRAADATPTATRRSIVIAPTWRNGLLEPATAAGKTRSAKTGFRDSLFIRSTLDVLNHTQLRELADRGYRVQFLPHPNLSDHFPYDEIPSYIDVAAYDTRDVQDMIANASVLLTDYSSVAFDAAFAEAAVVYMHLDSGAVYGMDHTLLRGYFDYERDGFGPVCTTVDATMQAVLDALEGRGQSTYKNRAREAFAFWDDGACARVYDAIDGPKPLTHLRTEMLASDVPTGLTQATLPNV